MLHKEYKGGEDGSGRFITMKGVRPELNIAIYLNIPHIV